MSDAPRALPARVVAALRCPHCTGALELLERGLGCEAGHRFDLARQGYVNLLRGPAAHAGDDAAMLERRAATLAAGHLDPILAALRDEVAAAVFRPDALIVDVGAGTGRQLAEIVEAGPGRVGLAVDVSRYAARRAARVHPRVGAVVADVWSGLPLADASVDVLLDVFAPRNGVEFARVLRPGGRLVLVTPATAHLAELTGPLGLLAVDRDKPARIAAQLDDHLRSEASRTLTWSLSLSHQAAVDLLAMGPAAHHLDVAELSDRVARLPRPVAATGAVVVSIHRR